MDRSPSSFRSPRRRSTRDYEQRWRVRQAQPEDKEDDTDAAAGVAAALVAGLVFAGE